jgi:hypothetical protein
MKRRQPTTLSVFMTAVAIVAAAALLSATVAPHNLAFAEKGGNGKGNNGNGKGNGGGNGSGNGNSGNGNNGNENSGNGNNGNGNANGNNKGSDDDGSSGNGDSSDDGGAPSGPNGATPNGRSAGGRDRIVRSEVVVTDASKGLAAFARAKGFQVVHTESLAALDLDVTRLRVPAGLSAEQARDLITREFPDSIVDFNHLYAPQTSLNLPAPDYAVKAVHWSAQLQDCGAVARLGLIDTAVDWSLPILNGAHSQAADFLEAGIAHAPLQHGTGIATLLVGQNGFGLLPGAELFSAGIFGLDGDGAPVASATSFASALNWLLTHKVATINVSLSGPPDRLMELAVKRAQQRGAELVAAVGNDGTTDLPRFPAAYSGVIGVTAVDQAGHVFTAANRGDFVALAAPGVNLFIPGQPTAEGASDRLVTGTSFAAPYVTAALASYGNNPAQMFADALDLGTPGPDPVFGRGLVQGPKACISAASAD